MIFGSLAAARCNVEIARVRLKALREYLATLETGSAEHVELSKHVAELAAQIEVVRDCIHEAKQHLPELPELC